MQGVLGPAVELWTFGSPGGLQIPNFSKCWASPPHLAKLGLRHQIPNFSKCWASPSHLAKLRLRHAHFKRKNVGTCAFSKHAKVIEFGHTPSYCIYLNSYSIFFPNAFVSHVPILCWSRSPHFEMKSCWTISKHVPGQATFCTHLNQVVPHMVRSKSHPLSNLILMNIHIPFSSVMTSLTNAFNNPKK
jgi:hypothetical protein